MVSTTKICIGRTNKIVVADDDKYVNLNIIYHNGINFKNVYIFCAAVYSAHIITI